MIMQTPPVREGKKLTAHGLNSVLFKMIQAAGGKVSIGAFELQKIQQGMALRVDYISDKDMFVLSVCKVEESPILLP